MITSISIFLMILIILMLLNILTQFVIIYKINIIINAISEISMIKENKE